MPKARTRPTTIVLISFLIVVLIGEPAQAHHSEKHNEKKQKHECDENEETQEETQEETEDDQESDSSQYECEEEEQSSQGSTEDTSDPEEAGAEEDGTSGSDPNSEEASSSTDDKSSNRRARPEPDERKRIRSPKPLHVRAQGTTPGFQIQSAPNPQVDANALEFVITADKDSAAPGEALSYTVVMTNKGTVELTGLSLVVPIPDQTQYLQGTASAGGVHDAPANTLVWQIPSIAVGGALSVTFQVKIDDAASEDQVQMVASVMGDSFPTQSAQAITAISGARETGKQREGEGNRRILPRTGSNQADFFLLGVLLVLLGAGLTSWAGSLEYAGPALAPANPLRKLDVRRK